MKQIILDESMFFAVGLNAALDGTIILQAFEKDGQAKIICTPEQLTRAFEDMLRIVKRISKVETL